MEQSDGQDPYSEPFNVSEELACGDSLIYAMQFGNGAGPTDISGFQFVYTAKRSTDDPDDQAVVQTRYTAQEGTEQSQAGLLSFEAITMAVSADVPPGLYQFDLRYMTPAAMAATLSRGTVNFVQPVGRNLTG